MMKTVESVATVLEQELVPPIGQYPVFVLTGKAASRKDYWRKTESCNPS
jgi:hypothetical protein